MCSLHPSPWQKQSKNPAGPSAFASQKLSKAKGPPQGSGGITVLGGVQMTCTWYLGTRARGGPGSAELMVGFDVLGRLFQP